jgi:hypothetical protein
MVTIVGIVLSTITGNESNVMTDWASEFARANA